MAHFKVSFINNYDDKNIIYDIINVPSSSTHSLFYVWRSHSRNDVVGECDKHREEEDYFTVSATVV